jgi:ribulose-phosphate 3-epimerase
MSTIIPAILEQTREGLEDKIFQVTRIPGVETIQVDFADGQFVPSQTFPIAEFDTLNPAFAWEAHLMVKEPGNFLDYQIAGFSRVILHYEAYTKEELLDEAATEITKLGMKPGIAINPETPISVLRYFGDTIKYFVIMSVEPGFQGSAFLDSSVERVAELRKLLPHAIIEVDGGIKANNAQSLILAGADFLIVGSALFETQNPAENYLKIQAALK